MVCDGDLMEGISGETGSLAGHLKLGKPFYLYDETTSRSTARRPRRFTEDVRRRYEAYGWQSCRRERQRGPDAIERRVAAAAPAGAAHDHRRPTTIGYGPPKRRGPPRCRQPARRRGGRPTKKALGWEPAEPSPCRRRRSGTFDRPERGAEGADRGEHRFEASPGPSRSGRRVAGGRGPASFPGDGTRAADLKPEEKDATRPAAGKALNAIAARVPELSVATPTSPFDQHHDQGRRRLRRPNGRRAQHPLRRARARHGRDRQRHGLSRRRPAVRGDFLLLLGLHAAGGPSGGAERASTVFVWTHDSIALGEDGPTHQPVEHLMSLRAMPDLDDPPRRRQRDGGGLAPAMQHGAARRVVLSRQKLPVLDRQATDVLARGAYVLADPTGGTRRHSDGDRCRGPPGRRRPRAAGAEGVADACRFDAVLGVLRGAVRVLSREVLPPGDRARLRSRPAARSVGAVDRREGGVVGLVRYGASAPGEVI